MFTFLLETHFILLSPCLFLSNVYWLKPYRDKENDKTNSKRIKRLDIIVFNSAMKTEDSFLLT